MKADSVQKISTGYVPRPIQLQLHRQLKRFNVLVCHRRFGKTVFCINEMIDRGLRCKKPNPRYAYLAPLYGQAKRVAWDYLKMYTANIPGVTSNEADLRVDIPHNGCRFTLLGADNPVSLKGIYLDGVILDEYAEMNPTAWREVIRPTLSDRLGWAVFIGTPKGRNAFYDMYQRATSGAKDWFGAMYKASETGILSKDELLSAAESMTEEEYLQEFECSFEAGLVGAYFAKELAQADADKRITDVAYDSSIPVDTYWDLGINDTTSIWFVQSTRGSHRVIDYYEICGASAEEIVKDLDKKPYRYGTYVMPHDAKARDLSTGRSQMQIFRSHGLRRIKVVPRVGTKRDSINAARMVFSKCYFDKTKCKLGLEHLAKYQRKFNQKNEVFEDSPLHNKASNAADAFQQLGLGERYGSESGFDENVSSLGVRDRRGCLNAVTEYDMYSYGG